MRISFHETTSSPLQRPFLLYITITLYFFTCATGYLPLHNIWPQSCRNLRQARNETELLNLITKTLCEDWNPSAATQVRCFLWRKFVKCLETFRRPRCGIATGQLVPLLPYWMGDDYNGTRVTDLRQGEYGVSHMQCARNGPFHSRAF